MTEEMRRSPARPGGKARGGQGENSGDEAELGAATDGAQRDMREILASIRKLMKETPAASRGAVPEARRREERARRYQTVAAPPRAPVDDWPDDPEIDVDALAEELLRMAGSLAERRGAALAAKARQADQPAAADHAPNAAWDELDALLSFAEKAFDSGAPDEEATASEPAGSGEGPQAEAAGGDELVAFPAPEHVDPGERMPDLSAVRRGAALLKPSAGDPGAPSPQAESSASERPEKEAETGPATVPAPPPSAAQASASAADATPELERVPAPAPSHDEPPPPDLADDEPLTKPDADESPDKAGALVVAAEGKADAQPPAQAPTTSLVAQQPAPATPVLLPVSPPAVAPPTAPAIAAVKMPDDPRNLPSPQNVGVLATIGAMVRAKAEENLKSGQSTYTGQDPHPRIVEKTGWRRGPQRAEAAQGDGGIDQPLTPTDLALRALEQDDAPDAVEPGAGGPPPPASPSSSPSSPSDSNAAQALRPVLADWLDQNFDRLMEDLIKERMNRIAKDSEAP